MTTATTAQRHPDTSREPHRPPGRRLRRLGVAVLVLPLLLAPAGTAAAGVQQHQPGHGTCVRHNSTIKLSPDAGAPRYRVADWLCQPYRPTSTVQVLLSGFTYDHRYWEVPGTPNRPTYVQAALDSGMAVLAVDRPGVGDSDRPPAADITATSEAFVAHQLVQALRDGQLGRYQHVVGVGHSYGSAIWMISAATYRDLDALVLTGYLHQGSTAQPTVIRASLYPAAMDPAFDDDGMPDGYLTTRPGTRAADFFFTPGADPATVAVDERTKSVGTTGELASILQARDPAYASALHLPTLLVVGDHDSLACSRTDALACRSGRDLCLRERGRFPADTALAAAVVPQSGHSINLHRTAWIAYGISNQWIRHAVDLRSPLLAATPCT